MMRSLLVAAALLLHVGGASAQLPNASPAALGMGDNFTAVARGYSAAAWNPALLALSDNPRTSLAVLPIRSIAGLDPVSLGDLASYSGEFLPHAVRDEWLGRIEREGSEQGNGGGDVTWIAAQAGRFAVQLSSSLRAVGNVSPGAAELILFGNYGRAGVPRAIDLASSEVSGFAASTLALSYGRALNAQITVGATLKYTVGHVLLHGRDRGTTFTADPTATINFPVVSTGEQDFDGTAGSGFGFDAGFAMVRGSWTLAATMQNVFNTFAWNEDELVYRAGVGAFDVDTHTADFGEQEFRHAPAHLRSFVDNARFEPTLAFGLAHVVNDRIMVTADFRRRLSTATIEMSPATHIGAGAEYLALPRVPLRAGIAYVEGGYQVAGGVGVNFGPVNVAASLMRRDTDLGVDTITMFTLISTTSR